jgi:hypothetical protein
MAWYRKAVGVGTRNVGRRNASGLIAPVDQEMADRILRYNEDDVLATLALRRWISERSAEVPSVADLDADYL